FFESSFGLSYHTGLIIVSIVVVSYTLFGGFLAVSYTDFVQGLIMFLALILVPVFGIFLTGGFTETVQSIEAVDPNRLRLWKDATILEVISSLAWVIGYFGKHHVIVLFMAIKTVKETKESRRIGIGWMALSLSGAMCTALIGIAYLQQNPQLKLTDPEAIFIELGQIIFYPFIAGIM